MVLASTQELEGNRLRAELAVVCGHLNVLHAQLVSITVQALATDAWHGDGVRSIDHWLAWQAGISTSHAHQITTIARRHAELPETIGLFTDGLLSLDQTVAVARHTPAHHDHTAAAMARNLTVNQLGVALSKKFFPPSAPDPAADPDARPEPSPSQPPAPPAHAAHTGFDDVGEFFLHANADPVAGALILKALQEAKDALFRAGRSDVTWLDALTEISRRSLDSVTSPTRRERYKVIIHVDAEGAWIHKGPRVPNTAFEHWTCNARVQPLWYLDGKPINLGRAQHIVPIQTRIVVENRDRICQHPTCTSIVGLDVHHIRHWTRDRGRTDSSNLICLCAFHHQQLHRGQIAIEGNADQPATIVFRNHTGAPITGRAHPEPPAGAPPPNPTSPYRHPLGGRLETRWLYYAPAPDPAHDRPPSAPEQTSGAVADPDAAATRSDRITDTNPGQPDRAPNAAAGPHAPPSEATNPAA